MGIPEAITWLHPHFVIGRGDQTPAHASMASTDGEKKAKVRVSQSALKSEHSTDVVHSRALFDPSLPVRLLEL